jgi:hypothetical protein
MIAGVLEFLVHRGDITAATASEIEKIIIPVHNFLPDYSFLSRPWQHENAQLVEVVYATALDVLRSEDPHAEPAAIAHELTWFGAGLLESISTWLALQHHGCSILADTVEHRVIQAVFSSATAGMQSEPFREAIASRMPSLGETPWEQIFDLRVSPFITAFRAKLAELRSAYVTGDARAAEQLMSEVERRDLRELARTVQPAPKAAILKAIVSNLPLPIPLNPASVVLSIGDVQNQFDRFERFGWLYFLLELERE